MTNFKQINQISIANGSIPIIIKQEIFQSIYSK